MGAPKGNDFATKPAKLRADECVQLRCRAADKAKWARAAKLRAKRDSSIKPELSSWIVDALNAEAEYEINLAKQPKAPAQP